MSRTILIKRITLAVFLAASCNLVWKLYLMTYLVGGNVLDLGIAASIGLLVTMNVRNAALSSFRLNVDDR